MVLLSRVLFGPPKKVSRHGWIDSLRIYVKGGTGGTGQPSKHGVGGRGGNVYVEASENIEDLGAVRRKNSNQRFIAGAGENSRPAKIVGSPGGDVTVNCPVGVSLVTDEGEVLCDLYKDKQKVMVARGGPGGDKSTHFLSNPGQSRSVKLDLKIIADVGFVGFPNAGKSTLLKAMSRAQPKIASYPFTTIKPNLGIVEYEDGRRVSLADLPGLIEGASYNVGMGHKFLKHVERTRLLLFVVDINGFQFKVNSPHRSALDTVLLLTKELELYKQELLDKPALLAITKMDSKGSDKLLEVFQKEYKEMLQDMSSSSLDKDLLPTEICSFDEVLPLSAKYSPKSVELLKVQLRHWMDDNDDFRTQGQVGLLRERLMKENNNNQRVIY